MEKRELFCTVGENVNWSNHYEKQYKVPQKLKIELPYDPAILLLGICVKKSKNSNWKRYASLCSLQHFLQ